MSLPPMTTALPAWTRSERDERGLLQKVADKAVWSNEDRDPPAIGERITINVNGIGGATVEAYFVEGGFLGLKTRVDKWPPILAKQNGDDMIAYVFGAEIDGKPKRYSSLVTCTTECEVIVYATSDEQARKEIEEARFAHVRLHDGGLRVDERFHDVEITEESFGQDT